jgi:hypothetical protein
MFVVTTFSTTRGVIYWSAGFVRGLMVSGDLAVPQAPIFDGLSFGPFALFAVDIQCQRVSRMQGCLHRRWHVDEVYLKVNGEGTAFGAPLTTRARSGIAAPDGDKFASD